MTFRFSGGEKLHPAMERDRRDATLGETEHMVNDSRQNRNIRSQQPRRTAGGQKEHNFEESPNNRRGSFRPGPSNIGYGIRGRLAGRTIVTTITEEHEMGEGSDRFNAMANADVEAELREQMASPGRNYDIPFHRIVQRQEFRPGFTRFAGAAGAAGAADT